MDRVCQTGRSAYFQCVVDPFTCRYFDRTDSELEEFLLFCIAVAGKTASTIARLLDLFLQEHGVGSPFETVRSFDSQASLARAMHRHGFGCHQLKARGWWWIARSKLDLRTCDVETLEECPGIGPKTSRFYLIHSRENARVACLDRHILRYLRDIGYPAPASTPGRRTYLQLEAAFLNECDKQGLTPHELDISLWNKYTASRPN